jgi:hypothetical protein
MLAAWAVLSALWAITPGDAFAGGARLLALAATLAVLASAVTRFGAEEREAAARGLILGVALGALLLLVELFAGAPLNNALRGFPTPPRLPDTTKPAATLLVLLAPPAILAAHRMLGWRAAGPLAALAVLAVAASTSEAARLGLAATLVAVGLALALPGLARRALPAVLAVAVLAGPPLLDQVAKAATRSGALPLSAVHRTLIWDYAAQRAAERPLAGFGMDAARSLPGGRDNPDAARLDRLGVREPARGFFLTAPPGAAELVPLHTHSIPLQVRLELGFVGLALAALFAFLAGRAVAALPGRAGLAAGAGVAAAVTVISLLSYGAWQHWWWVSVAFAGVSLAVAAAARSEGG